MDALTRDEIDTALSALGNWEYQAGVLARLARTDDPEGLGRAFDQAAGKDRDHVDAVDTPNGLVLRVRTPGTDTVTAVDVEVAARLEQVIELGGADSVPPAPRERG
ncbi:hypothetical protein [Nocardiopsis ansamitocini]|uniref:Uncharacterized protein n=1 Tax=Nocardiopsis ansamitocini TaxID=1670832 RepID=A0A9W6P6U1_9ACTN|nr:hypothetical protein [Nocardiopsis ansamitocini]GLU48535.1 hypothetical protein Nans01_28860 [Nocardiopsis ansamitocini]